MDEENKKEEKTFWQKAGHVSLITLKLAGIAAYGIVCHMLKWEPDGSPPEKHVDPDAELKRKGYEKTGVEVWYDDNGYRREKEIWSKK